MAFNITDVQANFNYEGARTTQFSVEITPPTAASFTFTTAPFLISATSLPESDLGNIPVPYFGRVVNFAGDRTYPAWNVTVMNDENFAIRDAMERWSNVINKRVLNVRDRNFAQGAYKASALVTQYNKVGDVVRTYRFNGLYPANISDIRLDWGDTNQFERFNVQFIYDYWDIFGGTTGDAGGIQ